MTGRLYLGSGNVNGMDKVCVCSGRGEGGGGASHTTLCVVFKADYIRNPIGFNWFTGNENQLRPFAS